MKTQSEKFDEVNKQMAQLSEERKISKALLKGLTQEVEKLKGDTQEIEKLKESNDKLKVSLKEAQHDALSAGDEAFERVKA